MVRGPSADEVILSVAIVTWNSKDLTRNCIQSVIDAGCSARHEIIVVDNGSTDGSAEEIAQAFPQVLLIRNGANLGPAWADNQALKLSRGRYFLVLQSDAVVHGDALERMVRFLGSHPHAGAVTCKLLNGDGTVQYNMHRRFPTFLRLASGLISRRYPRLTTRWAREYLMLDNAFDEIQRVEQAAGVCVMVRRRVLEEVGGLFDARRFPVYFHDVDLCYRLHSRGYEIYFMPTATVTHLGGAEIAGTDFYEGIKDLAVSSLLFFKKHRKYADYALSKLAYLFLFSIMAPWAFLVYMRGSITERVLKQRLSLPLAVLTDQRIDL